MSVETETRGLKRKKAKAADDRQLGLFDAGLDPPETPSADPPTHVPAKRAAISAAPRSVAAEKKPKRNAPEKPLLLTVEDMPDYPPELYEAVDKTLSDLKSEHMLMTYRTIKDCFGISRATVARRVKEGLVPGVRFVHGRVLEDGPVRRFDRTQVRWILLAVRFAKLRQAKAR